MESSVRRTCLRVLVLSLALPVSGVRAQQRDQTPTGAAVQFSSSPPGARSLGMGSTFVGIADDATAAESNPAGLTILKKPEVSAHFRHSRFDVEYEDPISRNDRQENFIDNATSPSFASVVIPFEHASASIYYHQSANFRTHAEFEGIDEACDCFHREEAELGVKLHNLGFAAAFKVGPRVSFGGSLRVTRLKYRNHETLFLGPNADAATDDFGEFDLDDAETRLAFNAGVMFNPGRRVSGGLVFKQGRTYDLDGRVRLLSRFIPEGGELESVIDAAVPTKFKVPQVYAGGIAFRPNDSWTIAADVIHTTYSDLRAESEDAPDNETELHGGAEYTRLVRGIPLSARFGLYTDPDHDSNPRIDSRQVHVTVGAGLVLQENFQIDGAASIADRVKEGLLSMVWRF